MVSLRFGSKCVHLWSNRKIAHPMPTNSILTAEQLTGLVEQGLRALPIQGEPHGLYQPVVYAIDAGGKRIRPTLVLASCNLFADELQPAMPAAMAVEVFHNFTLLHDDIMDHADLRRGRPTVHRRWGTNAAILSGDAMSVMAYELLAQSPEPMLSALLGAFNRLAMGVCQGQQLDMDFEQLAAVSQEQYVGMIELKTSALLSGALELGAIVGGAPQADVDALVELGRHMGIAFQLQDDLLDVYGDVAVFGKQTGGDIMAQKKTMLTVLTRQQLDVAEREQFDALMRNADLQREQKVEQVMAFYARSQAQRAVEQLVEQHFDLARQALASVAVPIERKAVLQAVLNKMAGRKL